MLALALALAPVLALALALALVLVLVLVLVLWCWCWCCSIVGWARGAKGWWCWRAHGKRKSSTSTGRKPISTYL